MFILPLVFVGILVWYLAIFYKWKKTIFDPIEKLPGAKYYPIFGTTYGLVGVPRTELIYKIFDILKEYGPLFRSWNGNTPEVNITKPEHLQVVMKSSAHMKKGKFYENLFEWLGEGLLISNGAKWFLQRKLLTPAFHFKILENFMLVFTEKADKLINHLETFEDGKTFNLVPEITNCTLDVICETAMGLPADAICTKKAEYVDALYDMTDLATWRFTTPYFNNSIFQLFSEGKRFRKSMKILHAFSNNVIRERKKLLQNKAPVENVSEDEFGKKKRLSFLDIVIDATDGKNMLTDNDVRGLVDTFLFAGFDTTTSSTCWSLFLLGNHPEIQEKVYEEVKGVLKEKSVATSLTELSELRYLECVIKEALRLYPVLPFVTRQLTEDIELDGYKIPAGVQAILHIAMVHKNPEQYPEPDKFVPERFLPENSKTRHPYAYIPFSAGPRNCIGQRFALAEEKTLLSAIIKKYKIVSEETPQEKRLYAQVLVRPQNGIGVRLERRIEETF